MQLSILMAIVEKREANSCIHKPFLLNDTINTIFAFMFMAIFTQVVER